MFKQSSILYISVLFLYMSLECSWQSTLQSIYFISDAMLEQLQKDSYSYVISGVTVACIYFLYKGISVTSLSEQLQKEVRIFIELASVHDNKEKRMRVHTFHLKGSYIALYDDSENEYIYVKVNKEERGKVKNDDNDQKVLMALNDFIKNQCLNRYNS